MNRYGIQHYHDQGSEIEEQTDGAYVLYEDYAAREAVLQKNYAMLMKHYHAAAQHHAAASTEQQRQHAEGQALIRAQAEEIERLNNLVQEKQTLLEFAEATINLLRPPARTC